MLHKKRSSLGGRKVSNPQPTYMNEEQKSNYLNDLRNNRPSRPIGSRPSPFQRPVHAASATLRPVEQDIHIESSIGHNTGSRNVSLPKSTSFQSTFTNKGRPLVNSGGKSLPTGRKVSPTESINSIRSFEPGGYDDDSVRKVEKEEAHFLKEALEFIDQKDEEKKIFDAAQFEAADLVWKHRNPQAAEDEKTAPYRNPDLESRTEQRKTSASRRRSNANRLVSSGSGKGVFRNPEDQIYEEPEETRISAPQYEGSKIMPLRTRVRNSLPRGSRPPPEKSMTMPDLATPRLNRFEIWKNPPSHSRDAEYVRTPPRTPVDAIEEADTPRSRSSLEIRGEDIRAATSMKRKDRSPNLPTPVAVSDNVGRPIVSFDPTWRPPSRSPNNSVDLGRPSSVIPTIRGTGDEQDWGWERGHNTPATRPKPAEPVQDWPSSVIPSISLPDEDRQLDTARKDQRPAPRPMPTVPALAVSAPAIPTIHLPDNVNHLETSSGMQRPPPRPMPNVPELTLSTPAVPTFNLPDDNAGMPCISIESEPESGPSVSISVPETNNRQLLTSGRPLPTMQAQPPRPLPHHAQSAPPSTLTKRLPWLSRGPSTLSSSVSCSICTLPISGRILTTLIDSISSLKARLHPECFTCHLCYTPLEHISFYPEPSDSRSDRLASSNLPPESLSSLRFYCHLDFHESFSPRCQSCKTPIEGSTVFACGKSYHPDHFFCGECGDPFSPDTPFVEKDGYAYCVSCHTKRTSARCRECKRQILDETVVEALGGKWHENCFSCWECKGGFGEEGRFFVREVSMELTEKEKRRGVRERWEDKAVCGSCEERRLKA